MHISRRVKIGSSKDLDQRLSVNDRETIDAMHVTSHNQDNETPLKSEKNMVDKNTKLQDQKGKKRYSKIESESKKKQILTVVFWQLTE